MYHLYCGIFTHVNEQIHYIFLKKGSLLLLCLFVLCLSFWCICFTEIAIVVLHGSLKESKTGLQILTSSINPGFPSFPLYPHIRIPSGCDFDRKLYPFCSRLWNMQISHRKNPVFSTTDSIRTKWSKYLLGSCVCHVDLRSRA